MRARTRTERALPLPGPSLNILQQLVNDSGFPCVQSHFCEEMSFIVPAIPYRWLDHISTDCLVKRLQRVTCKILAGCVKKIKAEKALESRQLCESSSFWPKLDDPPIRHVRVSTQILDRPFDCICLVTRLHW